MSALEYLDDMNESGRIQYDDYVNLHNAVSIEAVKAETTAEPAFVDSVPNDGRYEYTTSSDCDGSKPYYRARVPARHAEAGPWFPITAEEYAAASQNWGPEWRPVEPEGGA